MKHFKNKFEKLVPFYKLQSYKKKLGKMGVPVYIEKNEVYSPPAGFLPAHIRQKRKKRYILFKREKILFLKTAFVRKAREFFFKNTKLTQVRKMMLIRSPNKKPSRKKKQKRSYALKWRLRTKKWYWAKKNVDILESARKSFRSSLSVAKDSLNVRRRRIRWETKKQVRARLKIRTILLNKILSKQKQFWAGSTHFVKVNNIYALRAKQKNRSILKVKNKWKRKKLLIVLRAIKEFYSQILASRERHVVYPNVKNASVLKVENIAFAGSTM